MIHIAIWGAGDSAATHVRSFLKYSGQCRITAVINHNADRAEALVRKFDLTEASVFTSLDAAADAVPVDAVSICLPPAQHCGCAVAALEREIHVLTEKPMANSLEECDRMIRAAEKNQKLLAVIFQLRFTNEAQRIRAILKSGEFGPFRYGNFNSMWYRGEHYHDVAWRGTWALEGGGVLTAQAIHHLDLVQYLVGMPEKVNAVMANVGHGNTQCEDALTAVFRYPEAFAQFSASLVSHGQRQELSFHTERALLNIPWNPASDRGQPNGYAEKDADTLAALKQAYDSIPPLEAEKHDAQILNFLNAIEGKEPLLVDGTEGRKSIELTTAVYKSCVTGQEAALPITEADPFYTAEGRTAALPHFHEKTRSTARSGSGSALFA